MAVYFETLQQFQASGGMKATTITAKQLLPAVVAHMQRMDRKFTLQVNGRLPKSMDALLEEVFDLCHLHFIYMHAKIGCIILYFVEY